MISGKRLILGTLFAALLLLLACAPAAQQAPTAAPAPAEAPAQPKAPAPAEAPKAPAYVTPAAIPTSTPIRAAAAKAQYGGTFRKTYTSSSPVGWEPLWSDSFSIHDLYNPVGGHLVQWGEGPGFDPMKKVIVPDAAEKWVISGDGLTYTFNLRKGLMVQPPVSREVTSQDVKFSIERYACKQSRHMDKFASIKSIEVPDKYTVIFKLKELDADLLENLGQIYVQIHFKEALEPSADGCYEATGWKNIVGFGPFMKGEYNHGVNWTIVRNPNYYIKELPYLDAVEWIVMPDASTRMAAIRTGQIDINGLTCVQAKTMTKTNPEIQIWSALQMGGSVLALNPLVKPFDDIRVRQAASMAIDRKAWLDALNCGEGVAAIIAIPAGQADWFLPAEQAGPGAKNYEYNVAGAKKLLADAGYPNGVNVSITMTPRYATDGWVELVASYWDAAGLKTKIDAHEYESYVNNIALKGRQSKIYGFGRSDMYSWIFVNYHYTARKLGDVDAHIPKEMDPKLMDMIDQERRTMDPKQRLQVVYDIQKLLAEKMYAILRPSGYTYNALAPNIRDHNPHASATPNGYLKNIWKEKK